MDAKLAEADQQKLSPEMIASLRATLLSHKQCLASGVLGKTNLAVFDVDTGNHAPVCAKDRWWSYKELVAMKGEIDMMLQLNVIEPANSPWASRIVMVPKSDGKISALGVHPRFQTELGGVRASPPL